MASRAPLLALLASLVLQALGKAGALADSDGWWHLRTGRLILDRHAVPRTDPYSWTAHGERWHPNAWLSDTLFALLRKAGGLATVGALRPVTVVAFGLALYALARRAGARPWPAALAAAAGTWAINPFVAERPQLLSFLLLPTLVVVVQHALDGSRLALAGAALLVALWSNLHGVFVTGVAVAGLIAGGRALQHGRWWRSIRVVVVCVAAGLANPFGVRAYIDAAHVRAVSGPIQEWRNADLTQGPDQVLAVLLALALWGLWRTGRWRRLDVVLPVVALAATTADAIRNGPLLVTVTAAEVALGLGTLRLRRARRVLRPRAAPVFTGLAVAAVVLAVQQAPTLGALGDIRPADFPVRAVAAIPPGCRLLNEYDLGGFVIDRRPDVEVSQDGRNDLYGLARITEQQRVLRARIEPVRWLEEHGVDCVLAHRGRAIVAVLRRATGWVETVRDPSGILFVHV